MLRHRELCLIFDLHLHLLFLLFTPVSVHAQGVLGLVSASAFLASECTDDWFMAGNFFFRVMAVPVYPKCWWILEALTADLTLVRAVRWWLLQGLLLLLKLLWVLLTHMFVRVLLLLI